jgi:LacI family transcriptional regulator
MKLVAVDNAPPNSGFDTVTLDNARAAELAVSHLLSLGHRRIATMAGIAQQHVSRMRLESFHATLSRHGAAVPDEYVRSGDFRIEHAHRSCAELLRLDERPTALFVANNLMLIGVMLALADAHLGVPWDVSVASIDDFPWAAAFQPALTVVRQPIGDMAAAAFDRLTHRMAGEAGAAVHQVFAPSLVIRQSCAPPRGA